MTRRSDAFARRSAGLLLHWTSLPGPLASGDVGGAPEVLGFLRAAGITWWQGLPVHPPDGFASPYRAPSAFAGHPGLVDASLLERAGWLPRGSVRRARVTATDACDFARTHTVRERLLRRAHERFRAAPPRDLAGFRRAQRDWLDDWTLFRALEDAHGGARWQSWPDELRDRRPAALARARRALRAETLYHEFVQYAFDRSWCELRAAAAEHGVRLLGDLAMFVAPESCDAWAHRELFALDDRGELEREAGTPPDAFSRTGQRWGVPVFRAAAHRAERYAWWCRRVGRELELFDGLRLDHFIGYRRTFAAPVRSGPAARYEPGLGGALFDALRRAHGPLPFVAEDLGHTGPDVERLRAREGFPSTRVLQFGLDSLHGDDSHLPHNWNPDVVAYSGTHDNPTTVGWFRAHAARRNGRSGGAVSRSEILRYTGGSARTLHRDVLRVLATSVARTVVVPAQDLLGLGAGARMNRPGRAGGNWGWRLRSGALDAALAAEIRELLEGTGRLAPSTPAEVEA